MNKPDESALAAGGSMESDRLTEPQRRRAEENLGLVGLHLRRHVRGKGAPTRDCEREDLFQEGCLGLLQAARNYGDAMGMSFAAFALPRIRTAVGRALESGFATVGRPRYPRKSRRGSEVAAPKEPGGLPIAVSLDFEPQDRRADPRHRPIDPGEIAMRAACRRNGEFDASRAPGPETVGSRLRDHYVRCVLRAADELKRHRPMRGDRADLVDRVVCERLLIPEPHARTSMRRLSREAGCSYARVAQCEQRLVQKVRAELGDDLVFVRLREEARRRVEGMDAPIEPDLERELEELRVERFVTRLSAADPPARAAGLLRLIESAGADVADVARSVIGSVTPERRAALLADPGRVGAQERFEK